MKINGKTVYVGDVETTVYDGQEDTLVWASGFCKLGTRKCVILGCIEDSIAYLTSLRDDVIVYYHNDQYRLDEG